MKTRKHFSDTRGAFTLIELMVVIAIIGILAGLVMVVAGKVKDNMGVTQARSDMSQLKAALDNFKSEIGVYPPSRIRLYQTFAAQLADTSAKSQDAIFVLTKIAPRIADSSSAWTASGITWGGSGSGPWDLEGDQCLVFFLGGWQTLSSGIPGCQGFSSDPRNPWQAPSAAGETRKGAYFTFPPAKLVSLHTSATTASPGSNAFFSFLDSYGTSNGAGSAVGSSKPYAYFSAGRGSNNYNRNYNASTFAFSDCNGLAVWPYAQDTSSTPNRYWNGDSFQIICAGKDQAFARGTDPGASSPVWTPATAGSSGACGPTNSKGVNAGMDDLSNFYNKPLGTPGT